MQEERNEWLRQQDDYIRQLATAQADVKHQASQIHQLNEDAAMHRKAAEIWEEDRRALLDDRAEKERLKFLDEEHREAQRRWAATQEQLLRERSDTNTQLQLVLQQLEQQQKTIEVQHQDKAQWLKQQEAHTAARAALESRCATLESELNVLKLEKGSLLRDKEDLIAKLDRSDQDLTESGRHLAAARSDFERMKQTKNHLNDELDVTRKELDARKDESTYLESKLREAHNEVFFSPSSHHSASLPLFISPSSSIHLTLHHVCLATGKPNKLTECLYTHEHIQMQVKRLTEYESLYAHEREEKLLLESKMIQRASELQEVLLVNRRLPEYSSFSLYLI